MSEERAVVVPAAHADREGDQLPGPPAVRWGVLGGAGRVAQAAVLPAMVASPKAELVAVASQSHPDGAGYDTFGAARVHATYGDLLDDDGVEAVYIALPNGSHAEWTVRAAEAGKHVLCEKPLATRAAEAEEMVAACADCGVLLAEAFKTPFHPRTSALYDLLRSRRLGTIRTAHAVSNRAGIPAEDYRWRPEAGGGSLLDAGVDILAPIMHIARRRPVAVAAGGVLARSGVDSSFSAWFDFDKGFVASIDCSLEAPERQFLEVVGTSAMVSVERPFTPGPDDTSFEVVTVEGERELVEVPPGDGTRGLLDHFAAVLRDSAPLRRAPAESLDLLATLDSARDAARWEWWGRR